MRIAGLWLGVWLVLGLATAWGGEELQQGDFAIVKSEKAPLKRGSEVVAWVKKGDRMRVMAVQGGFALVPYKGADGEITDAYIKLTEIEKEIRGTGGDQPAEKKPAETGSGYHEDDVVVVVGKEAKLMMGTNALGPVAAGTRLTVKKLNEKWLGVYAPIDGKDTWGWIHSREVDYPRVGDKGGEKAPDKAPDKNAEKPPEKGGDGK